MILKLHRGPQTRQLSSTCDICRACLGNRSFINLHIGLTVVNLLSEKKNDLTQLISFIPNSFNPILFSTLMSICVKQGILKFLKTL